MFGTDFRQNHYMVVRVASAEQHRGLSRDWVSTQRQEQFQQEFAERLNIAEKGLADLKQQIAKVTLSGKAKKDLERQVELIERNLTPNLTFVAEQFGNHMETVTTHAKQEIGAYVQTALMRAGLKALQNESLLELPEGPCD